MRMKISQLKQITDKAIVIPGVTQGRGWKGSTAGSGQAGLMGQGQMYEVQQGQVLDPAPGSQQPLAMLQALGRVTGKLPGRKGPGGTGRQLPEYELVVCPGDQAGL